MGHLCRPIRANLRPRLLGHSEDGALAHGLLRLAIWLNLFSLVLLLRTQSSKGHAKTFTPTTDAKVGFLEASVRNADAAHQKCTRCIGGDQPTA
jgi:hypothetical protein